MSINNQIDILIENNKKLKPVNMTTFNNPFLMLSEVTALNNLVSNTRPSTRAETEGIERPRYDSRRRRSPSPNRRRRSGTSAPYGEPYDSHTLGHGSTIYEPSETEEQNLARHIMSEVYKDVSERRDIEGYTKLESLGDDRNVVYKSNKDNIVLYGIRGTDKFSGTDWLTDIEIGLKNYLTDRLPQGIMNERFDATQKVYSKIRELYPKSKIILAGHSLGNAAGLHVLYKNKEDSNLALYGFNGYLHPLYTGNKDPRYNPQRTAYDVVSFWDKNARKVKEGDITNKIMTAAATISGVAALTAKTISDLEKKGWDTIKSYTNAARNIMEGDSYIGKVGDPIMGPESFGKDINNFKSSEVKEWGLMWDANRAKQLALESETQSAETILEMEALIDEKEQLTLDLVELMPEVGGAEHFTQLVESNIPISDTLKKLGFSENILEGPVVTQEMLTEEAGEMLSIASKKRVALLLQIAKQTGLRVGGLSTLILGAGVAGIAIAHETENFPIEKNLFINN